MSVSLLKIRAYEQNSSRLLLEKQANSTAHIIHHGKSDILSDFLFDVDQMRWEFVVKQPQDVDIAEFWAGSWKKKQSGDTFYLSKNEPCKHISCGGQEICLCFVDRNISAIPTDDLLLPADDKKTWSLSTSEEIELKNPKSNTLFTAVRFLPAGKMWYVVNMTDKEDLITFQKRSYWIKKIKVGDSILIAGYLFVLLKDNTLEQVDDDKIVGLPVTVDNLSVSAPKKQLRKISVQIKPGEFVGVLGPSGCGKSVLIQRLMGFPSYQRGKLLIDGASIRKAETDVCFEQVKRLFSFGDGTVKKLRSQIAYIPQQVALHDGQTLSEEKQSFDTLHNLNVSDAYIYMLGLGHKLEEKTVIGNFSGGEKTRAAIALELGRMPRLLIFDEPTAGLDPASEADVMEYLKKLADQGRTVICSTHIMANLNQFDKVLVLANGKDEDGRKCGGEIAYFGTPQGMMTYFEEHFQCNDIVSIYKKLQNKDSIQQFYNIWQRSKETNGQCAFCCCYDSCGWKKQSEMVDGENDTKESTPKPEDIANEKSSSSFFDAVWHAFCGYWKRMLFEQIDFWHVAPIKQDDYECWFKKILQNIHIQRWGIKFLQSVQFLQVLLQPLIVMLVLKTACADQFFNAPCRLQFYCCIAVFWLGMNNAIRELVKERVPERGLDRLKGTSLCGYLQAKVTYTLMMCVCQVLAFIGFMAIPLERQTYNAGEMKGISTTSLLHFCLFLIVCITGAFVSLAVSAICKKENKAVTFLPILLIPVLFFSEPIIQNSNTWESSIADTMERKAEENKSQLAVNIEYIMPCHTPQILFEIQRNIDDFQSPEAIEGRNQAWLRLAKVNGSWILAALVIMIIAQQINEKTWNGRKD